MCIYELNPIPPSLLQCSVYISRSLFLQQMTTITVQHVIEAPHLKKPWLPECKVQSGITFVKLSKWDRGFVRFLTSRALDLGDKGTYASFEFFDELCTRRDIAFDAALGNLARQAEEDAAEAGQPQRPQKRVRQNRRARSSDSHVLPAYVAIDHPHIDLPEADWLPVRIHVLIDGLRTRTLFAELDAKVLDCIREGCARSPLSAGRRSRPAKIASSETQAGEMQDNASVCSETEV